MGKSNYNRIKTVLTEKGKTSRELARQLKKSETTVSRWCTNDVQPRIEDLYLIAKFLDADVRELLVSTK